MAILKSWVNEMTLQLHDERTNTKTRAVFPYADEPGFYSPDELTELVGYALEKFEADCKDKPTHIKPSKDFQHGLGETLQDIKQSRENRKEIGGPKYPLIVPAHLAGRYNA